MQTHQGLAHDGELDDGGHGLPLDGDGGGDQQPLIGPTPAAAVSQVHWRRGGLKRDSAPHTLNANTQHRDDPAHKDLISC